jgi:hypothetical protein
MTETKPENRDKQGRFIKGYSGNPGGRPKNLNVDELLEAVMRIEKVKGKTVLDKFVEMAYTNPQIMIALMKKFIPDQSKKGIHLPSN